MRCNVCGGESGRYPLCRACNIKKDKGEIIKCEKCGKWHETGTQCVSKSVFNRNDYEYLYKSKKTLISKSEQEYYLAIKSSLPEGYWAFPQVNLASFVEKTDNSRFHNELFRNVDFLITDSNYSPLIIVEINDQTHNNSDRKERDLKVKHICEEAGIPILKFWTSYGVNPNYIKEKIDETIKALPVQRIHHFDKLNVEGVKESINGDFKNVNKAQSRCGCYIATCVYGSYDCPQVWTLRRFRDCILGENYFGRIFIRTYYLVSPILVKIFGKTNWFKKACRCVLDKIVKGLQSKGIENTPYDDKIW